MQSRRTAPAASGQRHGRSRIRCNLLLLLTLLLAMPAASFGPSALPARAAGLILLPFAAGSDWYISQGYNTSPAEGWSHYNCDPRTRKDEISRTERCTDGWQYKYSFDLRQVDGTETGEAALSPVDGTLRWLDPANGGMSIDMGNGYAIGLFHLDLAPGLTEGQALQQGQPLGRVAPPGGSNNGGTPHIHLTLWQTADDGNWSRQAIPFTGELALDGYEFPDQGSRTRNQYWNTVVASSNQPVGELPSPGATPIGESVAPPVIGAAATPAASPVVTPVTGTGETPAASPGETPGVTPAAFVFPTLTLAAQRVVVGTLLTVNGAGFAPNDWVDLAWDDTGTVPLTETEVSANGTWTLAVEIPPSPAGPHRLIAIADTGTRVEATVEVIPALTREPAGGTPGSPLTVTLTGFAAEERVNLWWGTGAEPPLASVTTDAWGSATLGLAIPTGATGTSDLIARGQTSRGRATATVRVDGATPAAALTGGAMLAPGTFQVTATVLGLTGGSTSSGHVIQPDDRLVALPACTTTSCPWLPPDVVDPLFGLRVECGAQCFVRVTNPATGQCAVAPVLETGPWFTLDDWWNPTGVRQINAQPGVVQPLTQGYPAAAAALDGHDVGFGRSPSGIGLSNKGYEVGNRAAIDLATGTWADLGLDPNSGIADVTVALLWLTGEDVATATAACGAAMPATTPAAMLPAPDAVSPPPSTVVAAAPVPSDVSASVPAATEPASLTGSAPAETVPVVVDDPNAAPATEGDAATGGRASRKQAAKDRARDRGEQRDKKRE